MKELAKTPEGAATAAILCQKRVTRLPPLQLIRFANGKSDKIDSRLCAGAESKDKPKLIVSISNFPRAAGAAVIGSLFSIKQNFCAL